MSLDDTELARLFDGLDAPRPLPTSVREACAGALGGAPLEPTVRARLATSIDGDDLFTGLDGRRPLPDGLRERLAASLPQIAAPPADGGSSAQSWSARASARGSRRMLAIAAALVLLAGVVSVFVTTRPDGAREVASERPSTSTSTTITSTTTTTSVGAPTPASGSSGSVGGGATASPVPAVPGAVGAPGTPQGADGSGSPPGGRPATGSSTARLPYFESGPAASPVPGDGEPASAPEQREPIVVTVMVRGGADTPGRRGFDAYRDALRRDADAGVVIEVVEDAAISVDLGSADTPLTDALTFASSHTLAASLAGGMFGLAGAVDRQARLAVDVLVPQSATGTSAVVFREMSGVYGNAVPDAIEARLRARGVNVFPVVWNPDAPVLPPADLAFVALSDSIDSWVSATRAAGYAPQGGTIGLAPMADPALGLADDTMVVSPYLLDGRAGETDHLRRLAGPLTAEVIHGWVTAKALAAAVVTADADTPEAVARAMASLRFDTGFAPYAVRDGGNVRVPDGVVLHASGGRLAHRADFLDQTG